MIPEVTLTVQIDGCDEPEDAVRAALESAARAWEDGRYRFETEQIEAGLRGLCRFATVAATAKRLLAENVENAWTKAARLNADVHVHVALDDTLTRFCTVPPSTLEDP